MTFKLLGDLTIATTNLPDATTGTKGVVELAGDIGGTNTSVSVISITGGSGVVNIGTSGNIITWAVGTTAPGIKQSNVTTSSATGAALTIQAQNATGTTSTGGALTLTSGTGTTVAGNINIQTGGTTRIAVAPTTVTWSVPTVTFDNSQSSPTIKQSDNTTNSATGQSLTVQSQNATGTTAIGGNLLLVSGTGTSTNGNITFKSGSSSLGTMTLTSGAWQLNPSAALAVVAPSAGYIQLTAITGGGIIYMDSGTQNLRDTSQNTAATWTVNASGTTSLAFANTVTASRISQSDKTTNGGTGATLTIQAQNETGTTSTGGGLTLTSGTGTTVAGNLLLQTGGSTRLTVSPTLITSGLPLVLQGTNPATTGDIRAVNNTTIISARNAANGNNISCLSTDNSNTVTLGDSSQAGNVAINAGSGGNIAFTWRGNNSLTLNATGIVPLTNLISWFVSISAPQIQQDDVTTSSATGHTFKINAQNATGTTSTGGILQLTSGSGTSSAGNLLLQTGGTSRMTVAPTTLTYGLPTLTFDNTQTSPTLKQNDNTTNSATATSLTIQAQNATGTTATGGALSLTSGTGTTVAGNVLLKTGGTTALTISPTSITADVPINSYMQIIRYTVGTSATTDSTSTIPTGAYILSCSVEITTTYSAGGTISVGQAGSTTAFQTTSDNNPQGTSGDIYEKVQDTAVPSAGSAVRTTVGGSPASGASVIIIKYVIPNV